MKPETPTIAGQDCVSPDGGLNCEYPRIRWRPADEKVFLDGNFSPEELRAIADHMERGGGYQLGRPGARRTFV